MITQNNILKHELIGLQATILDSANLQLIGKSGKIIDETRSTLILDTHNGIKQIPKDINKWRFSTTHEHMHINGVKIVKRSAERLMIKV